MISNRGMGIGMNEKAICCLIMSNGNRYLSKPSPVYVGVLKNFEGADADVKQIRWSSSIPRCMIDVFCSI
jgi:hypothetical protein